MSNANAPGFDGSLDAKTWRSCGAVKVCSINMKADLVEPFFNHHACDTRSRNSA